jgi:class 3 adenylate cyclase
MATPSMGEDVALAVLFADVVGSTRLYERMGDQRARDMVALCIDVMRDATEQCDGAVIKTMGDEVMATFPSADQALNAAAQMQKQIAAHSGLRVDGQPVSIRIGCHYGPVVAESRDIFGSTVHTANRMTSQAKAGQIIITEATVAQLTAQWRGACRLIDNAPIKGRSTEVALYEVLWQVDDVTSMVRTVGENVDRAGVTRLRLWWLDRELLIDEHRPILTIGRADENDLVVKGNLVSRLHARIEYARHKFTLIDHSTNGTFVREGGGEEAFVRRDSLQLKGGGLISLGRIPEADSAQTIRFVCERD